MLNYIWLALICIGIGVAVGSDVRDISTDRYRNGTEMAVEIRYPEGDRDAVIPGRRSRVSVTFHSGEIETIYGTGVNPDLAFEGSMIISSAGSGVVSLDIGDRGPAVWKEIVRAQRKGLSLQAHLRWTDNGSFPTRARMTIDPVGYVRLNAVTNDGIVAYAKIAVELAIGLIGIMALWLGIMKIAEQSGLVSRLALLLKPVTTRLFPDVPAEHPAMGAMIMNISANMLGLANAATPLGLKAMEELNKLNKKLGTATDAMCTFLVINTSSVQLIPATVIAIRAAAGSANPTEIIGPVIVATTVNTTIGIITVKLLAKLPLFRRQLAEGVTAP